MSTLCVEYSHMRLLECQNVRMPVDWVAPFRHTVSIMSCPDWKPSRQIVQGKACDITAFRHGGRGVSLWWDASACSEVLGVSGARHWVLRCTVTEACVVKKSFFNVMFTKPSTYVPHTAALEGLRMAKTTVSKIAAYAAASAPY